MDERDKGKDRPGLITRESIPQALPPARGIVCLMFLYKYVHTYFFSIFGFEPHAISWATSVFLAGRPKSICH